MSSQGAAAAAPGLPLLPAAAFVVVWSSGYIAGPAGVQGVEPLTLVAARFVLAALIAGALARVIRGPLRIPRRDLLRVAATGIMLNAVVFGLAYSAFALGTGATLGALAHSLSPVLTALLAGVLLREHLRPLQVIGFALGVVGVVVVLGPDLEGSGGPLGLTLIAISVVALSLGTLGQRWVERPPDPLWSTTVQCAASAPPLVVLALLTEGLDVVTDPVVAGASLAWLVGVNTLLGLALLGLLVRAGGAGAASSLFFLMPPVTAVMAWVLLADPVTAREAVGLVISAVGVAAATRAPRRPDSPLPVGSATV